MAILWSITSESFGTLRVRERSYMESIGSYRIVLEQLRYGEFRIHERGYFKSRQQADLVIKKLSYFIALDEKRLRALKKIDYDYQDSIQGTKEGDFFDYLNGFQIRDCEFVSSNLIKAICSNGESYKVDQYLSKLGLNDTIYHYEIWDMVDRYAFHVRTQKGIDHCIFDTASYHGMEHESQIKLLFQMNLFTQIPSWNYRE